MTDAVPEPIPSQPNADERHEMIATAAYYLAEHRGFAAGAADLDWLTAERQIDAMLAAMRRRGLGRDTLARTGLRNALLLWGPPD